MGQSGRFATSRVGWTLLAYHLFEYGTAWAKALRRVPTAALSQTLRDLTNQALTFDVEARRVLAKEIWQLIKIRRTERWQAQQAAEGNNPKLCKRKRLPISTHLDGEADLSRWPDMINAFLVRYTKPEQEPPSEIHFTQFNPITAEEVQAQAALLREGKAAGPDEITPEVVKALGVAHPEVLRDTYNELLGGRAEIPNAWTEVRFAMIPKVPRPAQPSQFRPIGLISIVLKLLMMILLARVVPTVQLPTWSVAFQTHRCGTEIAFTLSHLLEYSKQWRPEVHYLKLDLSKAYDCVNYKLTHEVLLQHEELWAVIVWNAHHSVLVFDCWTPLSKRSLTAPGEHRCSWCSEI
eukprot:4440887-Amphidinium_carterae.1